MARRATVIEQERKQGGALLVLDAGNSLTGDQEPARSTQGRSSVEVLNRLGYDAIALGPADLSLGVPVLRQRIAEAAFAVLSADAFEAGTERLVARPWVVIERAGAPIAIIGLSGGPGTAEIDVRDPLEAARRAAGELPAGVRAIILLSQAGPETNRRIADAVPGITAVIEGGTPAQTQAVFSPQRSVPIYHADAGSTGHAGRVVGMVALELEAGGALAEQQWRRVLLGPEIADDEETAAWLIALALR